MTRTLKILTIAAAMGFLSAPVWASEGDRPVPEKKGTASNIVVAAEQSPASIQLVNGRRYYRAYRPYYGPYYQPYYRSYRPYYYGRPYYGNRYYGDRYYGGYYGRGAVRLGPVQVWW